MDKITLTEKSLDFMTRFAAPSVLTGKFVAAVLHTDRAAIEEAFNHPGDIFVHNVEELYADKTYTGYETIDEIRESETEIIVILNKGDHHGQE